MKKKSTWFRLHFTCAYYLTAQRKLLKLEKFTLQ